MMQQYNANSYLFGGNAPYVEELYEAYLNNPGSVPENWRAYFDAMQHVPAVDGSSKPDVAHAPVIASFAERAKQGPIRAVSANADADMGRKRVFAQQLIAAYRFWVVTGLTLILCNVRSVQASLSWILVFTDSPMPTWTSNSISRIPISDLN
jgi:2-oxoglutarate dehydrogenase complex dehydrogenase (E1) component-like enzyme